MRGHPYTHATRKQGEEGVCTCTAYAYPRVGGKSHVSHTHNEKEGRGVIATVYVSRDLRVEGGSVW